MNRQEYNRKIISKLDKFIEKFPDWRFGQILVNCGIIETDLKGITEGLFAKDPFYEESETTYNKISQSYNKFIK